MHMQLWKSGYRVLQTSNILLSLCLLLLATGCKEEFPTYATSISTPSQTFTCLNYMGLNSSDKQTLRKTLDIKNNTQCPYVLNLTRYHVGKCDNPIVKSVGGDFNGYVRIEVKKGFKCYYKVQSDFKYDDISAFERVLKKVKIDLNQENKSN